MALEVPLRYLLSGVIEYNTEKIVAKRILDGEKTTKEICTVM
jgi:hypothetical protein